MELEDIRRKIQFRQGSYVITIPHMIVHSLGLQRDQYVRLAVSKYEVTRHAYPCAWCNLISAVSELRVLTASRVSMCLV